MSNRSNSSASAMEIFSTPTTSMGGVARTELQQQRRWININFRDQKVISTAISSTGWLVTATATKVRLYDMDHQDHEQKLSSSSEFSIAKREVNERIRAVAISNSLLAVVTHYRLIVYQYDGDVSRVQDSILEEAKIDQNETWIAKSVAIMQVKSRDPRQTDAAWVAVGGEGVNGVKLFQYSNINSWNPEPNFRTILKCSQSTSAVRYVGFSSFIRDNRFIVFGVTSSNRIFCWDVQARMSAIPKTICTWELDSGWRSNTVRQRGEIASVSIFESPSGNPYIFCAVDQKHGSPMLQSFIAPMEKSADQLDGPLSHWKALPENATGRFMHTATVSPNGHFVVTVENGMMRLLTLCGAYGGGLSCLENTLRWQATFKDIAKDVSGVSVYVREVRSFLEVYAVDGRGHVVFARISAPNMRVQDAPAITSPSSPILVELGAEDTAKELSADAVIQRPRSDSGFRSAAQQPANEDSHSSEAGTSVEAGRTMEDEVQFGD
ncbi:hypothetical protein DM02DRAFT_647719 [Periconia macrospinosa]|uniref:WD40 repeat-like protein n=1 Tax=Periconia macrospinosa TaxID=97972 RepID=A0A2V1ECT8_9PLEO|nr:hypothetical protein DM02DRAFT_647719 [Periconia macrospinosa]